MYKNESTARLAAQGIAAVDSPQAGLVVRLKANCSPMHPGKASLADSKSATLKNLFVDNLNARSGYFETGVLVIVKQLCK